MADVQAAETAEERYERDWTEIQDTRKVRGLDSQTDDRQARLYVDRETGISATGKSDAQATALWERDLGE